MHGFAECVQPPWIPPDCVDACVPLLSRSDLALAALPRSSGRGWRQADPAAHLRVVQLAGGLGHRQTQQSQKAKEFSRWLQCEMERALR